MKRFVIGVDTSNYTTSAAAVLEDGTLLANVKRLLPVAPGERGLRQSDAVFAHVKAMPDIISELTRRLGEYSSELSPAAVGYSFAPREVEGSYMPCFLVGEAIAKALASDRALPVFSSSHQAGHIMAALCSVSALTLTDKRFAAFHVSGGTTELTLVTPDAKKIISVQKLGGTRDLNAGQLIDRVGVAMGESFPAGRALDTLALSYGAKPDAMSVCVDRFECNLSGAENKALKIYDQSGDKARTAAFVFDFIARTLCRLSENLRQSFQDIPIVYAGGVMSSEYIKERLSAFSGYHAAPELSSDNAVGCALLALEKWKRGMAETEVAK